MSRMTIQEAVASILGKEMAEAITNQMGIHWTVVVAMARALKSDDPKALAAIRQWQRDQRQKHVENSKQYR